MVDPVSSQATPPDPNEDQMDVWTPPTQLDLGHRGRSLSSALTPATRSEAPQRIQVSEGLVREVTKEPPPR